MRVLVTGATGYIGSAAAAAVAAAGHEVHGLAQSREAAAGIERDGLVAVHGDIRDAGRLSGIAAAFDGVIHAANTGGADAAAVDVRATRALLQGLDGGGVFVYTSGVWVLGAGSSDEASPADAPALVSWRPALELEVLSRRSVRGVVVRPGIVYGHGGGIPGMVARGDLPVIGDGSQRWPLVHVGALAELYALALRAPSGSILHGVTHTLSMRDLALLAAAGTTRAVQSVPLDDARAGLGDFADALALDQQVSSDHTRRITGWQPSHPSPVEEFLVGSYADAAVCAAA